MWKCIVFMSNPNAILKNGTVPTNSFISKNLPILDHKTWNQSKAYVYALHRMIRYANDLFLFNLFIHEY